jgi:hypothetical protein
MNYNKPKRTRKSKKPISHQHDLIITKCLHRIRNHTADVMTLFNLAYQLNLIGDTNEALKYYKKGLKRSPNNINALNNMSLILIALSDFAQAIIYLTRAIDHTPDQAIAYIYRSVAYLGAGEKTKAYLDFNFVYQYYPDKIHHFTNMDKARYPQIDFDEAIEFCLNPDVFAKPWPWPEVYFPTEDCPVDEICLQKEYCLQKEVCPQNDMTLFKKFITQPRFGHPREDKVKTILVDMDALMASQEPSQPEIVFELFFKVHSSTALHWKRSIHKLMRFYVNTKHKLNSVFNYVFLLLILPLNEFLEVNAAILEI